MHDGDADRARQHRRVKPRLDAGFRAEQRRVEAFDEPLKGLVFRLQTNDDGVEHRNAECAAPIDGLFDHSVEKNLTRPQGMSFCLCGFEHLLQLAHLPLGDRDDDFFLGLELPVDGRLGHAHLVGDHLQRRPADATLGDEFQRRIHHPRLGGGARDRAEDAVLLCGRHSVEVSRGLTVRLPIGYRPSCRSATTESTE